VTSGSVEPTKTVLTDIPLHESYNGVRHGSFRCRTLTLNELLIPVTSWILTEWSVLHSTKSE